jgi:hypothetical protein
MNAKMWARNSSTEAQLKRDSKRRTKMLNQSSIWFNQELWMAGID